MAMMDFPDGMTIVVVLFFVVFALNIVSAATLGRVGLAKLSRMIVRRKFLSEHASSMSTHSSKALRERRR